MNKQLIIKYTFIAYSFLMSSIYLQAQTSTSFNHLVFRETPFSKTEGRIPLNSKETQHVNHFKLSYNASNQLTLIEYKYQNNLIDLKRSGILDGKRALAPKTVISYHENTEIRLFFNIDNKPTKNGMGVFKEVYTYNEKGQRIGLKYYDENDKPINNSWNIFEYTWEHLKNNTVLEKRKDVKGIYVTMRPYYKFHTVLYHFDENGILISMKNVNSKMELINDDTGIAIDKATYDKDNNLTGFQFFNADHKPTVGSFLGSAGGFATYDDHGNCVKYATVNLDGNYINSKRSGNAYSKYTFDSFGNLKERKNYNTKNEILKRNGFTSVAYTYKSDDPLLLEKTTYHHIATNKVIKDTILEKLNKKIAKEKLTEDFNQLIESLKAHPTPFEFTNRKTYKNLVNTQRNKIKDSMTIGEFYKVTAPIVASLGCLHTRLVDTRFFRTPFKYWLPLIVWFEDDKMYATNNCVENTEMNLGSEILEINGITSQEIYKTLKSTISADAFNPNFYLGDLNVNFLYYYHSYFGFEKQYEITFKPSLSEKRITTTFTIDEPAPNYKAEINNKPRLSLTLKKEKGTAVIRIKNFNYFSRGKQNIDFFKEQIDSFMKQIKLEKINKVAFDLRGNRGGNPECTSYILSYLIDQDINFYEDNNLNKRRNRALTIQPLNNNIHNLKAYMIVDGRCASATAQMLAVVKHHKLAILIGKETGGTYSTHPGRSVKSLSNTKLALQIGTERESVQVKKLALHKGIRPDQRIVLKLKDIIENKDPVLDFIFNE